jgi:lysophospholipase L1-like esterase
VTRTATARRLAAGAAYGGGSVALGGAALVALLREEARAARRNIEARTTKGDPPSGDGIYGRGKGKSVDLDVQVELALTEQPDVALIMIGANDVTSRIRPAVSVRHLADAVRRLAEAGAEVVVGTCPDLGTIRPIAQPLRTLARRWSRQMAAAQTIAVVEAGGRTVSLGSVLGPAFASDRDMFSVDEFHPSAVGYAQAAAVLLPSVADAVGVWPASADRGRRPIRRGTVKPVAQAAARAASRTGTEVQPAEVRGSDTGPRGPWALLRRRRPPEIPTPEEAEEAAEAQVAG